MRPAGRSGWRAEHPVERLAARILQHQDGLSVLAQQRERPHCPRTVQLILQSVFMRQAIEAARRRGIRGGNDGQHRVAVAGVT
jgi:hypothetical protein